MLHNLNTSIQNDPMWYHNWESLRKKKKKQITRVNAQPIGTRIKLLISSPTPVKLSLIDSKAFFKYFCCLVLLWKVTNKSKTTLCH